MRMFGSLPYLLMKYMQSTFPRMCNSVRADKCIRTNFLILFKNSSHITKTTLINLAMVKFSVCIYGRNNIGQKEDQLHAYLCC